MLLYIISSTPTRLTALAVQKLFEIFVLSCARGNFIDGGLTFKDRLTDPNADLSVKCDCIGLIIEDSCIDLPKYASCGYLRFRSSQFRETTYNLLKDNQKREFHSKAIRYIEKETRRCRACGSGYFARILGSGKLDDGLRSRTRRRKFSLESQDSLEMHIDKTSGLGSSTLMSTNKVSSFKKSGETLRGSTSSGVSNIRLTRDMSDFEVNDGLGISTISRLKDNNNLVRTFSSYDYSQCTCLLILSTMYSYLIEHCKRAGLVEKIMEATIEYSYVCIETKNAPHAIKVLEEALQLLEGPMKDQIELEWMVELKRSKLFTIIGRARMYLDDDQAYTFYINALHCYGIIFPSSKLGRSILKQHFKLKQSIKLFLFPPVFSRSIDEDLAEYCNNVSECLNFLCTYFSNKNKWQEAELAAVWSLNKAMETESDFEILCWAYASMILIATIRGQFNLCVALEVFALRMCHRKKTVVEIQELKAVSVLYFQIGRSRFARGEIEKGMLLGYPIWRISNAARYPELLLITFPLLAFATILSKQIIEFGNILN